MIDILFAIIIGLTWMGLADLSVTVASLSRKADLIDKHIEGRFEIILEMLEIDGERIKSLERWRFDELNKEIDQRLHTKRMDG